MPYRLAAGLWLVSWGLAWPGGSATAQDGEEIIVDPELAPAPTPANDAEHEGDGKIIADPELAGAQGASRAGPPTGPAVGTPDPLANTGAARLELLGQVAVDLHHEGDLEDAYESRLRALAEVDLRRSEALRVVVGSRFDLLWAVPGLRDDVLRERGQRALDADRFEVDIIPTAAFVDLQAFDGFHLRLGEQVVSLGRMDFYAPTDALVIYDLRGQPRLDPAAAKLAQPAVRVDWDLTPALTLQAAYLPFFSPNLTRPNRDRYVTEVVGGRGSLAIPGVLDAYVDPSFQTKQAEDAVRFVGPAPDFRTPQAQARLAYRGSSFDLALSLGTALEKVPSVYLTPFASDLALYGADSASWSPQTAELLTQLLGSPSAVRIADIAYPRYTLLGGDAGVDVGPVSLGVEAAFSPARHLYTAAKDGKHLLQPDTRVAITNPCVAGQAGCRATSGVDPGNVGDEGIRAGVPVLQGALHAEWLKGESLVVAAEAIWIQALGLPHDRTRDWAGFIPKRGAFIAGIANASYQLSDFRFEGTVVVTAVGPSFAAVPRIELRAREGLFVDCGAQLFEGPAPGYADASGQKFRVGPQNINLGGLLTGYDQVFVSVRWLP